MITDSETNTEMSYVLLAAFPNQHVLFTPARKKVYLKHRHFTEMQGSPLQTRVKGSH